MRQHFIHHVRASAFATAAMLISVSAFGQTGQSLRPATLPAAAAQGGETVRRLAVEEAVRIALEQNLGIQIQRLDPQIQDESIALARAAWLPVLSPDFIKSSKTQVSTNSTNLAANSSSVTGAAISGGLGMTQLLPWGGNYEAAWGNSRSTTTSLQQTFNPQLGSSINFKYTQPLLRNFRIDRTRQAVLSAKKTRDISDVNLRAAIVLTSRNVKNAYWDLAFQIANLKASEQSLQLAQQSLKDNTRRVEIGTMAPIDIVDAKAEVARNEEGVILAQEAIDAAQDNLKMLIYDPSTPGFWNVKIDPTDTAPFQSQKIDTEAAVRNALDKRSDLHSAKLTLEQSDISIRYNRNLTLPDINTVVKYEASGVGGTAFAPIVNPVDSTQTQRTQVGQRSFGSAFGDIFQNTNPVWSVDFQVSYPLGRSAAKATLAGAKLQYQQSQTQLKSLQMQVAAQVRSVARQVEANQKRVESARASRELAEQKLAAEEKKFAAGIRETFFVFQAQRDLSTARTAEVRAISDYNKSLVDFEAVQEIPVGGGTAQITTVRPGGN